jgi:hypothetical protein
MFLISLVSAEINYDETYLGESKQGECIQLYQYCDTCTFVNITSIQFPDRTMYYLNEEMTKIGTEFNYTFCNTGQVGYYHSSVIGDEDGTIKTERFYFAIFGGSLGLFIIMFIVFYILTFYGIVIKNPWVSLFGCFGLLILGIYISLNGIHLYKNDLTNVVSYINIAIGLGIGFEALRNITDL